MLLDSIHEQLYAKYTVYMDAFGKHCARDEAYDFIARGVPDVAPASTGGKAMRTSLTRAAIEEASVGAVAGVRAGIIWGKARKAVLQ